jgi:uncharacterized protein involved in exopolysaccharide biosynthesis
MDETVARAVEPSHSANDGEHFLREVFGALWAGKWLILCVSLICALAAAAASWIAPKKYDASLLLSPVVNQSNGSGLGALSSAVSQLGGIASLAGLSMSGTGGTRSESLATLQSEALTQQFIQENNLLPILFASKWDPARSTWKPMDPEDVPTLWKANLYFGRKVRSVKEATKTGLVTLTMTWKDPKLAAQWANGLVKLTNDYLREKAVRESERNIAYLNDQVAKTSAVELRNSIYSLMESEIKKQMVARGSDEYALKVIDPATAPEKATSPQPVLWILGAFCGGILLSSAYLFAKFVLADNPHQLDASTNI